MLQITSAVEWSFHQGIPDEWVVSNKGSNYIIVGYRNRYVGRIQYQNISRKSCIEVSK